MCKALDPRRPLKRLLFMSLFLIPCTVLGRGDDSSRDSLSTALFSDHLRSDFEDRSIVRIAVSFDKPCKSELDPDELFDMLVYTSSVVGFSSHMSCCSCSVLPRDQSGSSWKLSISCSRVEFIPASEGMVGGDEERFVRRGLPVAYIEVGYASSLHCNVACAVVDKLCSPSVTRCLCA